ncbi:MAG: hypothetical protein DRJ51_07605 [Thermoprotei archaeon]|nr:MAG: hypothetical protein DRJ51_07605 [Thermoprotei archaeon]RLF02055.1 MAG: hypothetical protein DRJ59_04600 [Thermoprotei archaeon]
MVAPEAITKKAVKTKIKEIAGANIRVSDNAVNKLLKALNKFLEDIGTGVVEAAKARSRGESFMVTDKDVVKALEDKGLKSLIE